MKNLILFIPIFFFHMVTTGICSDLYSDKVRKYDSESFKVHVGGSLPHFVFFFAPWCGYCQALKPIWNELAEKYNVDSGQKLVIAKVDCSSETPLCAQEKITGYPALFFYDDGEKKAKSYTGGRTLDGLETFISENMASSSKKRSDPLPPESGKAFLELTDENVHSVIDHGLHFVQFQAPWCEHCLKMAPTWEELAQNSKEDKSVTISSVDCTVSTKTCHEFEIKGYPTMLWIVDGKKVKQFQGHRNVDVFKKFIFEMKSEHKERLENEDGRIPDVVENAPDLVVELVEANFENAINKGYSFVKFYTPWCGHSKKLAPIWNTLAIKFAPESDVIIAKVNCVDNEKLCEQYKVVGYPTLLLFHNGKHITEYSGSRKLERLHIFLLNYLHHTEL